MNKADGTLLSWGFSSSGRGNKQVSTYMRWTGWSQVVISPVKAPIGANMKATSKGARICLGWEAVEGLRGSGT